MKRAFIVVDLGYGDSGKGTITDALCRKFKAKLVVRYNGGTQASHNVVESTGRHHTFSQFGSGLFAGAATLLSRYMLVNPLAMENEAEALRGKGCPAALSTVFIDERALVTTPYHRAVNRLRELSRGVDRHGSCGMGIGETVAHSLAHPAEGICVKDILSPSLTKKLSMVRHRMAGQAESFKDLLPTDDADREWSTFIAPMEELVIKLTDWAKRVHILSPERVHEMIAASDCTVFEGAQGVLLDETYGFAPYTTWSNTTDQNAISLLKQSNWDGERIRLGIIRTFATRHGAGPFLTESPQLKALSDLHNPTNPWQREFRIGWPDLVALRYALDVNMGVDALAVTHLDKLPEYRQWQFCHAYAEGASTYLLNACIDTQRLLRSSPLYTAISGSELLPTFSLRLKTPVLITSHGPMATDKTYL